MIQGSFGSRGELFFEIDLLTSDGLSLTVDAMLDTGFTGLLAINDQDLEALNWLFLEEETLRTAQGEDTFDIYSGKILFNHQEFNVPVHVGNELTEVLLGSQWLLLFPLIVNFQEQVLRFG
jgi:predicted aspartyl protease